MELNDLIPLRFRPTHDCKWVVKNRFLMYHHYEHIPVAFIEDNIVYVFLDNKIPRQILKLTKWLMEMDVEFYFTTPELSNPKGIENIDESVISHYLFCYSQETFFHGFRKIDFDLIKNMVDWCIKEKCIDTIKESYDKILKVVERGDYDYWSNKNTYEYKLEIREDFRTLYRDIQINMII